MRTAVVGLTDRVELRPPAAVALEAATSYDNWIVSRVGSIAAADVITAGQIGFTAVSVYAASEKVGGRGRGYADGSAHRILSDLSALMVGPDHRLIVAGDWNLLQGYGEYDDAFWKARYDTVFHRAEAFGLLFVGLRYSNGRQADPWPDELPRDGGCVPTFHHSRQNPASATRQLDFVFASTSVADHIDVHALNRREECGPSDHCRVMISLKPQ